MRGYLPDLTQGYADPNAHNSDWAQPAFDRTALFRTFYALVTGKTLRRYAPEATPGCIFSELRNNLPPAIYERWAPPLVLQGIVYLLQSYPKYY